MFPFPCVFRSCYALPLLVKFCASMLVQLKNSGVHCCAISYTARWRMKREKDFQHCYFQFEIWIPCLCLYLHINFIKKRKRARKSAAWMRVGTAIHRHTITNNVISHCTWQCNTVNWEIFHKIFLHFIFSTCLLFVFCMTHEIFCAMKIKVHHYS